MKYPQHGQESYHEVSTKRTICLSFGGNGRAKTSVRSAYDFLKPEFVGGYGKHLRVDYRDRTDLTRQFMSIFLEKKYNEYDIRAIVHFLKRFHLTRSEIHAIIFHLDYRYKKPKVQGNLKIDGYYDANKGSFIQNIREK